jgi:phospholipid transport system substrate-binding protein
MNRLTWLLAMAAFVFGTSAMAESLAPDVLVKNTATEVLELVKKDKDIQNGDTKKIVALTEEKIVPHFNFERMTQQVLGRNWRKASDEQQGKVVSEFRNLLVRTYSTALSKYRNQTIEFKPLSSQPGDTKVKVKTQILQSGSQPVKVDYTLEKIGEVWKVTDVEIEGVSIVTSYRSQFDEAIKQGGVDNLIQQLVDKNRQNSTASAEKKQG